VQFTPYLSFNGNCEQAFKFYEQALGAKIESTFRYEGSPMAGQVPTDWGQRVMHGAVSFENGVLMGADAPPGHYQQPAGFSVCINAKDPGDAERKFEALSKAAKIVMPIQQTFWARRFGMLIDQFGIPWMISCE
jgi:PhnB protein